MEELLFDSIRMKIPDAQFRMSTDSMVLADFCRIKSGSRVDVYKRQEIGRAVLCGIIQVFPFVEQTAGLARQINACFFHDAEGRCV